MTKISAILLAGVVLVTASVKAANVSTSSGDVILGIRVNGAGQGSGSDYLVDLGAYSTFLSAAGTIDLSSRLSASDLSTIFGNSWDTRTDLLWSVFAANNTGGALNGAPNRTLFGTFNSNGAPGQSNAGGSPYARDISGNQGQAAANIAGVQAALGNTAQAGTANAGTIGSGTTGSYTKNGVTGHTIIFGASTNSGWSAPGGNFENNTNVTGGAHTSDFYEVAPDDTGNLADAALLGYFSLGSTSSANESFFFNSAVAAIPEPSTIALTGMGLGMLAAVLRRKSGAKS